MKEIFKTYSFKQMGWFIPFASIGLVSFTLLRPLPVYPPPQYNRIVTDARGSKVHIAEPFTGAAFTWGTGIGAVGFLEASKEPNALILAGTEGERQGHIDKNEIITKLFPNIFLNKTLWSSKAYEKGQYASLEKALAYNPGVYLTSKLGPGELLRKVGLPVLYLGSNEHKTWDDYIFSAARVSCEVVGHPQRAEELIAYYKEQYAEIAKELNLLTCKHPRILIMGTDKEAGPFYVKSVKNDYEIYLPRAGVLNASKGWTGERVDTERILGMDPDYIFLMAAGKDIQIPQQFMNDPRWSGLKAVRDKRVYRMFDVSGGGLLGLVLQPVSVRWMAEITHPEAMKTGTREMLRRVYLHEFGYRLSDQQIDEELHINVNKDSTGYERFSRDFVANKEKESLQ